MPLYPDHGMGRPGAQRPLLVLPLLWFSPAGSPLWVSPLVLPCWFSPRCGCPFAVVLSSLRFSPADYPLLVFPISSPFATVLPLWISPAGSSLAVVLPLLVPPLLVLPSLRLSPQVLLSGSPLAAGSPHAGSPLAVVHPSLLFSACWLSPCGSPLWFSSQVLPYLLVLASLRFSPHSGFYPCCRSPLAVGTTLAAVLPSLLVLPLLWFSPCWFSPRLPSTQLISA